MSKFKANGSIRIVGARVHNLKNIDLEIPREQLVVITGVSGSGKSSLAFDTIYAEGYRKYMDSLSTRMRQLLEQLPRPEVDYIEGLSPVIAIEQRTGGGTNPRSTVATITEIADFSRLLWSVCGEARCPKDGAVIERRSLDDCIKRIYNEPEGSRMIIVAPFLKAKTSVLRGEVPHLIQRGYQRIRLDGEIIELENESVIPSKRGEMQLDLVIDRVILRADQRSRIADSLELAFREGRDRALILISDKKNDEWRSFTVSQHLACQQCGEVYEALSPSHFSWDHPRGSCSVCSGLGVTMQFAPELLVPDSKKSVRKGAIKPLRLGSKRMIIANNALMKQLAEQLPFDPNCPWEELESEIKQAILFGTGDRLFEFKLKRGKRKPEPATFDGVLALLEETQRQTSSDGLRSRYMAYQVRRECHACKGERLGAYSRSVLLDGITFSEFMKMNLAQAQKVVEHFSFTSFRDAINGLKNRLKFLNEVGLSYLSLDRPYDSLSGGESQRVRLATQLGMGLVGVTYVLDEPTVGLHPADTKRLLDSLIGLRERGNSVLVVEHDPDIIKAADHLIEIGPGAGESGGRLVFEGTVKESLKARTSKTGAYLSKLLTIERHSPLKEPTDERIELFGASENNLQNIDVEFPVGLLTVVTGVSGSGKSTLVNRILGAAAAFKLNRAKEIPGRHTGLKGLQYFDRVVRVDQSPIGRSPRSNPATFTKLFDDLRKLFASTPLSKIRGYAMGRFSFNVKGGRCERCQGDGQIKLDMQFLNDVYTECPSCNGNRYNRETLEVRFKGYSISDVLNLTVDEALELFAQQPRIVSRLMTLQAVGLGYLRLGQSAPTLSGGEAQRLKLSLELSKGQKGQTLYILDEPTTGLHWEDIQHLMDLIFKLRNQGHTLIIIEHNLDVVRLADWIIDMGPAGGDNGGNLVFSGSVLDLIGSKSLMSEALEG